MSVQDIIRAWKSDEANEPLNDKGPEQLPPIPVGRIELRDEELVEVNGGTTCDYKLPEV